MAEKKTPEAVRVLLFTRRHIELSQLRLQLAWDGMNVSPEVLRSDWAVHHFLRCEREHERFRTSLWYTVGDLTWEFETTLVIVEEAHAPDDRSLDQFDEAVDGLPNNFVGVFLIRFNGPEFTLERVVI